MQTVKQVDLPVPLLWKVIYISFSCVSNRYVCLWVSFFLLFTGYILDSFASKSFYLTSFSSVMVFLGLVLTIKNHYLKNLTSVVKMASALDGSEPEMGNTTADLLKEEMYRNTVIKRANDEGIGIIIILVGTLFNAFGSLIPLLILNC
ncbi:hypothetical protein CH046_23715 [Salmonella enterica subsp. enterica serovar Derby]|nr:hypothetical protein [Salmonella enterica subsp. enterica serovar Derby]EGT3440685.1 hypothetical protein [Salmonella enterica subsp. enterica serovar Soerenga]ELY2627556.1 hypothetical protein [Cronobacter sakazakii]